VCGTRTRAQRVMEETDGVGERNMSRVKSEPGAQPTNARAWNSGRGDCWSRKGDRERSVWDFNLRRISDVPSQRI
jgi:hypothetical protein